MTFRTISTKLIYFCALVLCLFLSAQTNALAAQVTLAWDANEPAPDGYRLFLRTANDSYNYSSPVWSGTGSTCTIDNLADSTDYFFVVRAYVSSNESGDSNEVSFRAEPPAPINYTISATAGANGTLSPSGSLSVQASAAQTFTITANPHYYISDVLVDNASIGAVSSYTFNAVYADHTISAIFAPNTYTIYASAEANGSISPAGGAFVTYGGSRTYTVTADAGYAITDVIVDGQSVGARASYTFASVSANHTITAQFEQIMHTLNSAAGPGGSISPAGTLTLAQGSNQTYQIAADAGYAIADVAVDGQSVGARASYTFASVSANHTITAQFEQIMHTLNSAAGPGGSISPAGTLTLAQGSNQTYQIAADAGYAIADVAVDGQSVGARASYTFASVSANHTITAQFEQIMHTLNSAAGPGGSISPAGTLTLAQGSNQTYQIAADAGYAIADVAVDGQSVGARASYTFASVSANHTITAQFEQIMHTLNSAAGPGGSISPAGTLTLAQGSNQTYQIAADAGYAIADVAVDGLSVGAVSTFTLSVLDADHTVHASFTEIIINPTISASAGVGGTISPFGQVTVVSGTDQTFDLTTETGYEIEGLYVDGVSLGPINSFTFSNVIADHTIEARFNLGNQPPVTDAGPNQTVNEETMVNLSGSNSMDTDDGIASYQWQQLSGPAVDLADPTAEQTTFVAPTVDQNGVSLEFELTATDYCGESVKDTCIVNVTMVNASPVANAGDDQIVDMGDLVLLDAAFSSDPDNDTLGYQWRQISEVPMVRLVDADTATPSFAAPDVGVDGASVIFELTVTDGGGLQDTDSCMVTIRSINVAPLADAGGDQVVGVGDEVTLDGSLSSDSDGTVVKYQWKQTQGTPVELSDASAVKPLFTAPMEEADGGDLVFELTVTDDQGLQGMDTCRVSVSSTADITAPEIQLVAPSRTFLRTRSRTLDIKGSAWDNREVVQVRWHDHRGRSGIAQGTTVWQIDNLYLLSRKNTITITAYDAAGNQKSLRLRVYVSR